MDCCCCCNRDIGDAMRFEGILWEEMRAGAMEFLFWGMRFVEYPRSKLVGWRRLFSWRKSYGRIQTLP